LTVSSSNKQEGGVSQSAQSSLRCLVSYKEGKKKENRNR